MNGVLYVKGGNWERAASERVEGAVMREGPSQLRIIHVRAFRISARIPVWRMRRALAACYGDQREGVRANLG